MDEIEILKLLSKNTQSAEHSGYEDALMKSHKKKSRLPIDKILKLYQYDPELVSLLLNKEQDEKEGIMEESEYYKETKDFGHFNEPYAKYIVSSLHHTENGRKLVGEKFNMNKAKEVCERYKNFLPYDTTPCDVYVAINIQYHDYCKLFKEWFGNNMEQKIIESAISHWFGNNDYKLWNYIKKQL